MKSVFITSTGRTGTDFFTTLFNDYVEKAWSLHEPRPTFRRRGQQMIGREHTVPELLDPKINKAKNQFFPQYTQWPSFWKEQFWEIAGETMQKYGYSEQAVSR